MATVGLEEFHEGRLPTINPFLNILPSPRKIVHKLIGKAGKRHKRVERDYQGQK
jgi:hypothetical protein